MAPSRPWAVVNRFTGWLPSVIYVERSPSDCTCSGWMCYILCCSGNYTHLQIHTYVHAHIDTQKYRYIWYMNKCDGHTHIHMLLKAHRHTHTHTHACTHSTHLHTHARACTHTICILTYLLIDTRNMGLSISHLDQPFLSILTCHSLHIPECLICSHVQGNLMMQ